MKQIHRFILGTKIKYKLILSVYIVVIPILIIVSGYIYYRNYKDTIEDMTNVSRSLAKTVDENIEYLQNDIVDLSTYITINNNIRYILNADLESLQERYPLIWERTTSVDFVRDTLSIKNHIKTTILYPENGLHPFYVSRDGSVHNTDIQEVRNMDIYQKAREAQGDIVWTKVSQDKKDLYKITGGDKIVASRVIFDLSKKKKLGFLAIGIDAGKYESICSNALQNVNEGIVVCNSVGEELIRVGMVDSTVFEFAKKEQFGHSNVNTVMNQSIQYGDYYVFNSQETEGGNIICYMVPQANWSSRLSGAKTMALYLGFALLICIFPLSALASSIITKPLQKLYHSMVKFKEGDFSQRIKVTGNDEIGEVTACFNQMVKDIKQLIDTNYIMVIRERQSELAALQAQINPHFLYNALDSLYWQAINSGSDKLAEDIFSLSQLFRLVLSKGESEITVEREMELISNYLHIQKMRFQKKLNYEIHIEEELLQYKIPKLILQPFVENAIVHGLECIGESGTIVITGKAEGDNIHFEVRDNGIGMTKEQLQELYLEEEHKEYSSQRVGRYAIKNIRERLALKYHDDFVLDIQSEIKQGTTVTLIIPVTAEEL